MLDARTFTMVGCRQLNGAFVRLSSVWLPPLESANGKRHKSGRTGFILENSEQLRNEVKIKIYTPRNVVPEERDGLIVKHIIQSVYYRSWPVLSCCDAASPPSVQAPYRPICIVQVVSGHFPRTFPPDFPPGRIAL